MGNNEQINGFNKHCFNGQFNGLYCSIDNFNSNWHNIVKKKKYFKLIHVLNLYSENGMFFS